MDMKFNNWFYNKYLLIRSSFLIEKNNLVKYIKISIFTYLYVLTLLYLLVESFQFSKLYSYVFVYISIYIIEYLLTLIFLFSKKHTLLKFSKFIIYIFVFLTLSSTFYNFLLFFEINYLLAALIVTIALMPIRYFLKKNWIYI